jgi:stress-induced morphogen
MRIASQWFEPYTIMWTVSPWTYTCNPRELASNTFPRVNLSWRTLSLTILSRSTMTSIADAVAEKVCQGDVWLSWAMYFLWSLPTSIQCWTEFNADHVECVDLNADGADCDGNAKLELVVVSSQFEGTSLLQRHRKVNAALTEFMPKIHALSMKTWTPAQYESKKWIYVNDWKYWVSLLVQANHNHVTESNRKRQD